MAVSLDPTTEFVNLGLRFSMGQQLSCAPSIQLQSEPVPEKESTADTGLITGGLLSRDGNAKELRNE